MLAAKARQRKSLEAMNEERKEREEEPQRCFRHINKATDEGKTTIDHWIYYPDTVTKLLNEGYDVKWLWWAQPIFRGYRYRISW